MHMYAVQIYAFDYFHLHLNCSPTGKNVLQIPHFVSGNISSLGGNKINVALNPSQYLYNDLAAINILKNIL